MENITSPGKGPVDGDWVNIVKPSGATERRRFYKAPEKSLAIEPIEVVEEKIKVDTLTDKEFKKLVLEKLGIECE